MPKQIAPSCMSIPAGWPRPYYMGEDLATGEEKRMYTQWSSAEAKSQIHFCDTPRLNAAFAAHACSSCAQVMEHGLLIDIPWLVSALSEKLGREIRWDGYDSHYGSPICLRCCLFALRHCPWMSKEFEGEFGDDMRWHLTRGSQDYYWWCEDSGAIHVSPDSDCEQVTTAWIRAEVKAGQLHLTDRMIADLETGKPLAKPV